MEPQMPKELQVKMCADRAKEIFAKDVISDADAKLGAYFINKWKELTNHVERTQNPVFEDKNYLLGKFAY